MGWVHPNPNPNQVESDVLRGYPASPLLSVARLSVAVLVSLSYPLQALLLSPTPKSYY